MYVDMHKLEAKINDKFEIRNKCAKVLEESYSDSSISEFIQCIESKSSRDIIQNSTRVMRVPQAHKTLMSAIATENLSLDELIGLKEDLKDIQYPLTESMVDSPNQVLNLLDTLIESKDNPECIVEDNIASLILLNHDRSMTDTVSESTYLYADMDIIIRNINTSPEVIDDYIKVLRDIDKCKPVKIVKDVPKLLERNTNLVLACTVTVTGDVLRLLTSLPRILAYKMIDAEATNNQKRRYTKFIDQQLGRVHKGLINGDNRQFTLLKAYLDELRYSKEILEDNIMGITSEGVLAETIADMQPTVPNDIEEEVVDEYIDDIAENVCHILYSEDVQTIMEAAANLCDIESLMEGKVKEKVIKGAVTAAKGSNKIASKIGSHNSDNKRVGVAMKNVITPFTKGINRVIEDLNQKEKDSRREKIVSKSYRSRINLLIIQGIKLIAGAGASLVTYQIVGWTGPIIILIGVISNVAKTLSMDSKERREMIHEMETELKITREKIEDAKGDEHKASKYQLMRIEQKLEKEIERLKFDPKSKGDASIHAYKDSGGDKK